MRGIFKILFLAIIFASGAFAANPPPSPNQNTSFVPCSGVADDVAINAAIVYRNSIGGGIVTPVGSCNITSAILPLSNVWIKGAGIGGTILQLSNNNTTVGSSLANVIYAQASASANLTNFGISDLTIDGNISSLTTYAANGNLVYYTATGTVNLFSLTYPYTVSGSNNGITFNLNSTGVVTATIASSTYATPQTLISAIQTAVTAASATVYAYVVPSTGFLVLSAPNQSASLVVTNAGNASITFMGAIANIVTFASTFSDNVYNGIEVRGSTNQNYQAKQWFIRNIETRNNGFHGIAVYDGADEFTIEDVNSHNNGARCIHVHSAVSKQPSTKYSVINNRCHDDGQTVMTPATGGSGLFVFFNGTRDVVVADNIIWNEPDDSLAIFGASDSDTYVTDGVIVANNTVLTSGNGIQINSTTANLTGVTVAGNSVRDVSYPFIVGSATTGLTISAGNNTLTVQMGAVSNQVTIPSSTYSTAATLATAVQTAIDSAFIATPYGVTVTATSTNTTPNNLIKIVPIFTDGNINDVFSVSAGASNSAYAYIFGSAPVAYGNSCNSNITGATANCVPTGTRSITAGNGLTMLETGSFQMMDFNVSNNRIHNTGYAGVKLYGTSSTYPITKLSFNGNIIDSGGLDQGVGSGCMLMQNLYEVNITGNNMSGCNNLGASSYQMYLVSHVSNSVFNGNMIDSLGAGVATPINIVDNTSNYNIITGNYINRGTANTGNMYNNAGIGNLIYNNMLGSVNSGTAVNQPGLGATATIGGSALTVGGACATGTANVANASIGQAVSVTPASLTAPGAGFIWFGSVTTGFSGNTPGVVTVSVCALAAGTPVTTPYNVRVIP